MCKLFVLFLKEVNKFENTTLIFIYSTLSIFIILSRALYTIQTWTSPFVFVEDQHCNFRAPHEEFTDQVSRIISVPCKSRWTNIIYDMKNMNNNSHIVVNQ